METTLKPLIWLGSSRADVRAFPRGMRHAIGHELFKIQNRLPPASWKPMPSVGSGVVELRIQLKGAFRVLYVAKFDEGVYVLHAFQKHTRKTGRLDLELARARFRNLEIRRKQRSQEAERA